MQGSSASEGAVQATSDGCPRMDNPRRLLQHISTSDLKQILIPKWLALAQAHRDAHHESAVIVPTSIHDAIPVDAFVELLQQVLTAHVESSEERLCDALLDVATVVDVCGCGWVTWSAFAAFLVDTADTDRMHRWTLDAALLAKWRDDASEGMAQARERRKEAVLLWDEDVHDYAAVLSAVDPGEVSDTLRRDALLSFLRRRKPTRNESCASRHPATSREEQPVQTLYAMTPFLLTHDTTAEVVDNVQCMVDVSDTPFVAAFTRSGRMFLLHRRSRLVERSVEPVVFESTVSAAAFAHRLNFGRSVPGLTAFGSFLAVTTTSLRLLIVCCRSFKVRIVHNLPEPINALVYCHRRHLLMGGTTSGSVVLWAIAEKGYAHMVARWSFAGSGPITALSLTSSTGHSASDDPEVASDLLIIGFHDGTVTQVNLPAVVSLRTVLRDEVARWRHADAPGATNATPDESFSDGSMSRIVLRFRPKTTRDAATGSTPAPQTPLGNDGDDDASTKAVAFLSHSPILKQLVAVCADGTVHLFPKDFPHAPCQSFTDPTRRGDDRIVFAALDADATSVVMGDFSTNVYVVSLVSLTVTWKRHLHLAVVEGLAQRGRVGPMSNNPLNRVPRCFCGLSLRIGDGINLLMVNTGDGCAVLLLDSVSDPSSGSLFARDSDDLLLCEPLVRNPALMVVGNPHQVCLYDMQLGERFAVFPISTPELLIHPSSRRHAQRATPTMTALCVSLDGKRLHVGSVGSVSVARLDTGRALWRFALPTADSVPTCIVPGGVGNVGPHMFLCITNTMHLAMFAYEPHVHVEHSIYQPLRVVHLLGLTMAMMGPTLLSSHVRQLHRLSGAVNAYWYVSADARMSLARWDAKLFEWVHQWIAEGPKPCVLRDDDSVFTSQLLAPMPLNCIGTLHGEILLVCTRPHVQHGECIARWRQNAKRYGAVRRVEAPDDDAREGHWQSLASEEPSLRQPALTAFCFVAPYTLFAFDATGEATAWDVSDVVLQLRCGSIFDKERHALAGTAQRCFVHAVPRPPIVTFVGSETLEATVMQCFQSGPATLTVVDADARVTEMSSVMTPRGLLPHLTTKQRQRAAASIPQSNPSALWRRARKVMCGIRALWRLSKAFHTTLGDTHGDSIRGHTMRPVVTAFASSHAVIVCTPSGVNSRRQPTHRTMSLANAESLAYTFDSEGRRFVLPPQQASLKARTGPARPTDDSSEPLETTTLGSYLMQPKVAARHLPNGRGRVAPACHANGTANGAAAMALSGVNAQRQTLRAQQTCFGFDPITDPSYHTMKRQAAYMNIDRTERLALAVTFVSRVVQAKDPIETVADVRTAWRPFCSLKDEVETAIPSEPCRMPLGPPPSAFPYGANRTATRDVVQKPRHPSRGIVRCATPSLKRTQDAARPHAVARPASAQSQTRKVGFVSIPRGSGERAVSKPHPTPTAVYFV